MESPGAYPADRAAALSGVPKSTVHDWHRKDVLIPSVSPERVKLWSWSDLIALRVIYWLRQPKQAQDGSDIPRSKMPAVRKALDQLRELDLDVWSRDEGFSLAVDRGGQVVVGHEFGRETTDRQRVFDADEFDILRPFDTPDQTRGPDLVRPGQRLRIIPGKLGGEPHIERTRLETQMLAALARRGFERENIYRLYPIAPPEAIDESLALERQLERNLVAA